MLVPSLKSYTPIKTPNTIKSKLQVGKSHKYLSSVS